MAKSLGGAYVVFSFFYSPDTMGEGTKVEIESAPLLPKPGSVTGPPGAGKNEQRPFSVIAGACYFTVSASMVRATCPPTSARRAPPRERPPAPPAGVTPLALHLAQILLNKAALSSFHFTATNSLLFFQCALCVLLVYGSALAGWVEVEPLNWNIVRVWMPVNLLFTSMIGTGFYALQMMGVQMVS